MTSNCDCRDFVLETFGPNFIVTQPAPKDPIRTLYVGHIIHFVTEDSLRTLFSRYGQVVNVFIKKPLPQKKHTFGFVTYEDPSQAELCLKNKFNLNIKGNRLFVNPADNWHQPTLNPDGSLQFKPRHNNHSKVIRNSSPELNYGDDEDVEDSPLIIEDPDPSADDSLINKLNDDCLLKIFDNVPLIHKHLLNSVCKRWDALMTSYWHRLRTLDFQEGLFSTVPCHPNTIRLYLQLCPNIKTVKIKGNNWKNEDAECISAVAENAPQVEEVCVENANLTGRQLPALAHYCKGLRSLSMINCRFLRDDGISSVLKKCLQLEELNVYGSSESSTGYWLQYVTHGLKKLSLNINFIDNRFLSVALRNAANSLEDLSLHLYSQRYPVFFGISKNLLDCPDLINLKKLSLTGTFSFVPNLFRNLTVLVLECNDRLSDEYLKKVIDSCPDLEKLSLSESGDSLTEQGLMELNRLEKLTDLNLSKIDTVNDVILKNLTQHLKSLTHFRLGACDEITDTSVTKVVTDLPHLTFLDITACCNISVDVVMAARAAADANPRKETLTIVPYGTRIGLSDVGSTAKVILSDDGFCSLGDYLLEDFSVYDEFDSYGSDIYDSDVEFELGSIFDLDCCFYYD